MFEYDEDYYLENNPDVAAAVRKGEWPSGLMHYCVAGRAKNRRAARAIDVDWYVSAYPRAALEIATGKASSARDHYHRLGKYRGYLASLGAPRQIQPAAPGSRSGGLWTDAGNAMDIVAGRLGLGQITLDQAKSLKAWVADGYVVIPNAVPETVVNDAETEVGRAYRGEMPGIYFTTPGATEPTRWIPEVRTQEAAAIDLHWFSEPLRQAIFSDKVLAFLHLIFERPVLASQTLSFWRGACREVQQDSARSSFSLPLQFASCWIALENIGEGEGGPYCYRGSHRLAEFAYAGAKGTHEAERLKREINIPLEKQRHLDLLKRQITGAGISLERPQMRRGDALLCSADLAHGEDPVAAQSTRKSVLARYCPAELAPHYFERDSNAAVRSFGDGAFYSSEHHR